MIHTLLKLERPLICLDTETTGVDTAKDRIIELGFQLFTSEGLQKEWRSLIHPTIPIPPAATAVHHITDEMLLNCQKCGRPRESHHDIDSLVPSEYPDAIDRHLFHGVPMFRQLAENLARGFVDCDYAGQNVRFDLRILASEMTRAGVEWSYAGARIIDSGRLEQIAIPRHLSDLHKKYTGAEHEGAHGALSDVRAAVTVIGRQLEEHSQLPRDLAELHELQWPGWLTADGAFRTVDGVACCTFGKHKGVAVKDIPKTYFDWILSNNFPEDVKALARKAKLGEA